jgi:hypothetical protein
MTRRFRRSWLALVSVAVGLGLASCDEEGGDTRNLVQVVSLNEGIPLLSDVYHFGANTVDPTDDFIPTDVVEVIFQSRKHDDQLTVSPGKPFGTVRFHSYRVMFNNDPTGADLDGDSTVDLFSFTAPMQVVVPTGGTSEGAVLIISGAAKVLEPISCLGPVGGGGCGGNSAVEYAADAYITFFGTEETSGAEIEVNTGLTVRIAQFGDE